MKRRKKAEQKVMKRLVPALVSQNEMSAVEMANYYAEKRIEKLFGKPAEALVRMPVVRDGLALTVPNGAPQTHVAEVPPTQKGVDEVLQACRDALHVKSDR